MWPRRGPGRAPPQRRRASGRERGEILAGLEFRRVLFRSCTQTSPLCQSAGLVEKTAWLSPFVKVGIAGAGSATGAASAARSAGMPFGGSGAAVADVATAGARAGAAAETESVGEGTGGDIGGTGVQTCALPILHPDLAAVPVGGVGGEDGLAQPVREGGYRGRRFRDRRRQRGALRRDALRRQRCRRRGCGHGGGQGGRRD